MMETQRGNAVVWVLVLAVVGIIVFLAYQQGYFGGSTAPTPTPSSGVNINLPIKGQSPTPNPSGPNNY